MVLSLDCPIVPARAVTESLALLALHFHSPEHGGSSSSPQVISASSSGQELNPGRAWHGQSRIRHRVGPCSKRASAAADNGMRAQEEEEDTGKGREHLVPMAKDGGSGRFVLRERAW